MNDNVLGKPMPYLDEDMDRWEHTALRKRMLEGQWKRDLEARVLKELGDTRRDAWGEVDIRRNPFRSVAVALAALYDAPAVVIHPDSEPAAMEMSEALTHAGYWQIMQRAQRDCIGMREVLVVPQIVNDEDESKREILFRLVSPDLVCARANPDHPDEPVWLAEASLRNGEWGWDIWDVRNPEAPSYHREDAQRREIAGTRRSGDQYPFRFSDNRPYIQHVIFHASRTGRLWDAFENRELVDGTLSVGVLWTFFGHSVRNASWPQRWTINAKPSGSTTAGHGASARESVTADPAMVLQLEAVEEGMQPSAGQWQNSSDPAKLQEAISAYEQTMFADVPGLEATRSSGDPRSGYALAVSREAQRAAQRRFSPVFSRGDRAIMRRVAAMLGTVNGIKLPDDGYELRYASLPPSPDERAEDRAEVQAGITRGTLSPVDVYMREHPGLKREAAIVELRRIAAERAVIQSAPLPSELLSLVAQAEAGTIDPSRLPDLLRQIAGRIVSAPIIVPTQPPSAP
jgi:hypothetical protein